MKIKKENTTSGMVAEGLRNEINFGRLVPGDKILERELADKFKVSHIPVREALKVLEGEGFVVYEKFAGYRVREISADEMMELYAIMRFLMTQLLTRAIPRYTEMTYYHLRTLIKEMNQSKEADKTISLLIQFAETIFYPAGMNYTYNLSKQLFNRNIPILQGVLRDIQQGKMPTQPLEEYITLCQQNESTKAIKFLLEKYDKATKVFVAYMSDLKKKKMN